jgi:hypothetical protein
MIMLGANRQRRSSSRNVLVDSFQRQHLTLPLTLFRKAGLVIGQRQLCKELPRRELTRRPEERVGYWLGMQAE